MGGDANEREESRIFKWKMKIKGKNKLTHTVDKKINAKEDTIMVKMFWYLEGGKYYFF
jgi:hypothetical protein